jgi:hypothetical protein
MKVIDIKEGKTFYQMRISRTGKIYGLNKVNIDAIRGNIEGIFQMKYSIPNSHFISYTTIYERRNVKESNSPYFIKLGGEEYITLPNKQALMKAVKAQITKYSTYPFFCAGTNHFQSKLRTAAYYRDSMKKIKQLH